MALVCPICKSPAEELDRTGDATRYYCATHTAFKVVHAVVADERAKDYTSEQWEAALLKAKQRRRPGEWPLITTNDFRQIAPSANFSKMSKNDQQRSQPERT